MCSHYPVGHLHLHICLKSYHTQKWHEYYSSIWKTIHHALNGHRICGKDMKRKDLWEQRSRIKTLMPHLFNSSQFLMFTIIVLCGMKWKQVCGCRCICMMIVHKYIQMQKWKLDFIYYNFHPYTSRSLT